MKIKSELLIGIVGFFILFMACKEWGNYAGIIVFLAYVGIVGMLSEICWTLYEIKNMQSRTLQELKQQ